jgi:hypothetical protein
MSEMLTGNQLQYVPVAIIPILLSRVFGINQAAYPKKLNKKKTTKTNLLILSTLEIG